MRVNLGGEKKDVTIFQRIKTSFVIIVELRTPPIIGSERYLECLMMNCGGTSIKVPMTT